jgi:hypothetical protein
MVAAKINSNPDFSCCYLARQKMAILIFFTLFAQLLEIININ